MSLQEYWHGDPELVSDYFTAELIRKKRVQREFWYQGVYMQRAIVSSMSKDDEYFDRPLPSTDTEAEEMEIEKQEENNAKLKASLGAWLSDTRGGQSE